MATVQSHCLTSCYLNKVDPGENIDSVPDLIPVKVATSEVPLSRQAGSDGESLPAVKHPKVVEDRQVALAELVLHTEVLVAGRVEKLQSLVNFFAGMVGLESLGAPDLVVEADLLDLPLLVQLNGWPAEPLVKCCHLLGVLV